MPEPFTNEWADLVFGLSDRAFPHGEEDESVADPAAVSAKETVADPVAYEEKQEQQAEQIEEGYRERGLSENVAKMKAQETVEAIHGASPVAAVSARKRSRTKAVKKSGASRAKKTARKGRRIQKRSKKSAKRPAKKRSRRK